MKILVVVDMQKDFTSGALGNKECNRVVSEIVNIINAEDFDDIILTRDTHQNNYLETQEGKYLPVVHCIEGTDGWQIRDEIMCAIGDKKHSIINKSTFGSVNLATALSCASDDEQNKYDITLVGVCTGICVISNALLLKAYLPEARIAVRANACACVTPESHKTALDAMKLCQIEIEED